MIIITLFLFTDAAYIGIDVRKNAKRMNETNSETVALKKKKKL